ncbi:MAG: hypothetical protein ACOY94_00720 [Bacillota bacterium]
MSAVPTTAPTRKEPHWVMVIDLQKCIGFRVNDLMRQDDRLGLGSSLVDALTNACAQYDTRVEVERAAATRALPGAHGVL